MVLLGMVIPLILFFAVINVTYSFFTSRAEASVSTPATGTLKISLEDPYAVSSSGGYEVYPGEDLEIESTIENTGNTPCYSLLKFSVTITPEDNSVETLTESAFYSLDNNGNSKRVVKSGEDYVIANTSTNATAFLMEGGDSIDFVLTHTLDGETITNDYQNASIYYSISGFAIQATMTAENAVIELIENIAANYEDDSNVLSGTYHLNETVTGTNGEEITQNIDFISNGTTYSSITITEDEVKYDNTVVSSGAVAVRSFMSSIVTTASAK